MVIITKCSQMLCMVLVLTLMIHDIAECSRRGASLEIRHRKLYLEMKEMALKKSGTNKVGYGDSELRRVVPAGPDPLHHNGRGPNKPETP